MCSGKFAASTVCSLMKHIQYKHLEVKYPSVNMLQLPCQLKNQNEHEGVRYPCKQCNFTASNKSYLKRHFEHKHYGVMYPCTQCELAATTASALKNHNKTKHNEKEILVLSVNILPIQQVI